jgi:ATP-dependent helicase/nuclease subunit A
MSAFTKQQAEAVNGCGNVLVVAGAGTGKTHTLIARCLRLVVEDRVSLENILMVTFTEAAAAEMRGRLRQELLQLQAAQPDDEWLAQQLGLLDTARISTLHGFCLQLAREHFHALSLDPQFTVLDETQTRPLQREALDELLEQHYSGSHAAAAAVRELIRTVGRGADQRIRQLILKLHAHAQSLPDPAGWLEGQRAQFAANAPDEWRRHFIAAAVALRADWLEILRPQAGQAPALRLAVAALEALPARAYFSEAAALVGNLMAADSDENWPHGTKGPCRDPLAEFFAAVEFLNSLAPQAGGVDPLAQDWSWVREPMTALLGLVQQFAESFTARKRDLGGVDFADLEQCALRLLRDETIALQWRARLAHLFVDEYQDINAAQDAILTALSRIGAHANRFLVGDVKQSIYRFRLANPKIFQRYHDLWDASRCAPTTRVDEHSQAVSLTENFRSREAIINFVNPLFAALMRREVGGVDYEPLVFGAREARRELAVPPGAPPPVEFHLIAKADDSTAEENGGEGPAGGNGDAPDLLAVEREARLVARRLHELKAAGEPVWDKEQKRFRPVKWSDMAVLLRSPSGRAEAFAMEFNRAGVPLSAARDGFFASLEVSDLLNLLKLLDNPLQDVPLLAVLRSPLVALTLEELAAVRAQTSAKTLFWTALVRSSEAATNPGLKLFLDQFTRWRELVRQTSLSQCLETALNETHYEALLLAGERGAERVANVRRLLDLARQFDPYQRQGLYRFLRFVRLQEEEELDLEPAAPPSGDAVRLVSIHKSKGLEFPVVALAGLGTKFNEQDLSAAVLLDERLGLCPKIFPPEREQSYPGLTHWLARRQEKRELRGEELRLFYVALTRARDRLILVGTTHRKADAARWESAPTAAISTGEVAAARSHLDWLLAWLSRATTAASWRDDFAGENELLRWNLCHADDPIFAPAPEPIADETADRIAPTAADLGELNARLAWSYPLAAATTTAAKTSVTALRRQAEEADDEAEQRFEPSVPARHVARGRLSATEVGLAHHAFLQWVDLAHTTCELELWAEGARLQRSGRLSPEQTRALDVAALAAFWQSEVGALVRDQAATVRRELEFTARFSAAELAELTRTPAPGLAADDFIVVQGVADLVVLLPDEIWLLDFKTDRVSRGELPAKVAHYEPQLQLYAVALARIYRRPVTRCWLHFLAAQTTVGAAQCSAPSH